MLKTNTHTNKELQADYNLYGQEAFEVEIVEYLKKKKKAISDEKKSSKSWSKNGSTR